MPARNPVAGAVLFERREGGAALIGREAAARREAASLRQPRQRGNQSLYLVEPRPPRVGARRLFQIRQRAEQPRRIGVAGAIEQIVRSRLLDLAPGVHDDDAVGVFGHHAHVVRDQNDRGASCLLQFAHQVEDLRLDRHVERGRRLVGDQQLRVARQRHRDHRALPHAARQLVRVGVHAALRLGYVHPAQRLDRPIHRLAARDALVQRDRFADLAADRHQRVQRCHRLLEDHRDRVAADVLHRAFAQLQQIDAGKADRAADDAPRRVGHETQDRQRGDALAAAGLADDPQRLAGAHRIGDPVDRPHDARRGKEMRPQFRDLEQRRCRFRRRTGAGAFNRLQVIQV